MQEKKQEQENADDEEETTSEEETSLKVTYVVTKLWNCRVRGLVYQSDDYESCLYRQFQYNLACVDSEWASAGIERVTYANEDELEEILIGYRECEMEWDDDYYDEY